jgi:hypothetical protein
VDVTVALHAIDQRQRIAAPEHLAGAAKILGDHLLDRLSGSLLVRQLAPAMVDLKSLIPLALDATTAGKAN